AADATIPAAPHLTSGDEQRYSDKSASYSKPLKQDGVCLVNPQAWISFKKALRTGLNSDFEAVIIGGTRTMNGPQSSYAYDLECLDSTQFGAAPAAGDPNSPPLVPPFDKVTSKEWGTQLIEMYWASMLRDVAFTDYGSNATAQAAAAELSTAVGYRGPKDGNGQVTTDLLFRGAFQGETIGPWMSQLMITPCSYGAQPLDMLNITYLPGLDYMTDTTTFLDAQNGIDDGIRNQPDSVRRYLHDFRGLGAYTHVDVLYQGYFTALMALGTLGAPPNPGGPYIGS